MLSILVNARTGFLVAIIGVVVMLLFSQKKISVVLASVVFIVFIRLFFPFILLTMDGQTVLWLTDFFNELDSLFVNKSTEDAATINTLTKTMVVWPDNIFEWIFGRGYSIFLESEPGVGTSDVGWILQLNMGGIILFMIWLALFKTLFRRIRMMSMDRSLIILIIGTILIGNTKGDMLGNTGMLRLVMLIMLFFIYDTNKSHVCNGNNYHHVPNM